jgi:hypothetical protein
VSRSTHHATPRDAAGEGLLVERLADPRPREAGKAANAAIPLTRVERTGAAVGRRDQQDHVAGPGDPRPSLGRRQQRGAEAARSFGFRDEQETKVRGAIERARDHDPRETGDDAATLRDQQHVALA